MEPSTCFVHGLFNQSIGDFTHHIENIDLNCLVRKIHGSFSCPLYLLTVYLGTSSIYAVKYICLMESRWLKPDLTASFHN